MAYYQGLPPLPGSPKTFAPPLRNIVYKFPDLSDFVESNFFKTNQKIITKYLPHNLYYLATPPYKPFRIWVISTSANNIIGYHTAFTIDCTKDNIDDIEKQLEAIGGNNQTVYAPYIQAQNKADSTALYNISQEGIETGKQEGYNQRAEEDAEAAEKEKEAAAAAATADDDDNSGWSGFKKGFSIPVQAAMGAKSFLGLGLSL